MNHTTQEPKSLYLAVELEYRREYEAAHELRTMQARIADLEAQLYAIGAGGVGESIRPAAIDAIRLAEATFRAYGDHPAAKPDEEKAQRNYQLADTMRAALLAAVPDAPNPARQPLTEDQLRDALRQCPHDTAENLRVRWLYAKDFARAIEAAVANQPPRQPLTDSQVKELVKKRPAEDLCRWSYGMGIKDAEAAHGITESQL